MIRCSLKFNKFAGISLLQDVQEWAKKVSLSESYISSLIQTFSSDRITVTRDLKSRDVSGLNFCVTCVNSDNSRTSMLLRFLDMQSGADIVITNVTTNPEELRGLGHGSQALQELTTWAKNNGIGTILATQVSEQRSRDFWIKNNFARLPEPNPTEDFLLKII